MQHRLQILTQAMPCVSCLLLQHHFQIRIRIQLCAMCISDPDPDSAVCPMSVLCPDPDPVLCHVSCLHPAQRRLLLSVLAGVGLAAFAVIPTEKLSLKPSKPLYFYIVPLLRIQVGAGGAGGGGTHSGG